MANIPSKANLALRDVILTGSIVVPAGDSIVIEIADLSFKIAFESTADKKPNLVGDVADKTSAIRLQNFDNPLGASWAGNVGFIEKRYLHMAIFVHALTNDKNAVTRSVAYTFSLGEVMDGK